MVTYDATTESIEVSVRPVYIDGQSDALARRFVFAYFIRIENRGSGEVQLLRRHWIIKDDKGGVQEVEGKGVIGEQPVIPPGGEHNYNSFCVLPTFTGSMKGTYLMQRESGERFRVQIPRFDLRAQAN